MHELRELNRALLSKNVNENSSTIFGNFSFTFQFKLIHLKKYFHLIHSHEFVSTDHVDQHAIEVLCGCVSSAYSNI